MLLLDAGVWIAAKDEGDRHVEAARTLVTETSRPVAAMDLTLYEVVNVIGVRWRQPDIASSMCRTISARCGERVVSIADGLIESCLAAASEHGLTAYDAAYVAAARRYGWTLVSADIADLVSKGLAVTPDAALYP